MNTYSVTYWPPPPQVGTQPYNPITVTVTALDFTIGEDMIVFVDDNRSVVFSVPTGVYPVVQRTATA